MKDTRTLKIIVTNLIRLYLNQQWRDMEIYRNALEEGLNRYDLAAVKQGFNNFLMNR